MKQTYNKLNKKAIAIYLLVFIVGVAVGLADNTPVEKIVEKEVKVTEYKTPQACKDVIGIDNGIFSNIADNIVTLNYDAISAHIDAVSAERILKANECQSK